MNPSQGWPFWLRLISAALLGAIAAFGLAPFGIWAATVIALILLSPLFLTTETRARAAWLGWAFATGYFAHALSWIVEPFLVDVQRHGWMAPFALTFMAGGLALFWGLAFWVVRRPDSDGVSQAVFLAISISLLEYTGRAAIVSVGAIWAGRGDFAGDFAARGRAVAARWLCGSVSPDRWNRVFRIDLCHVAPGCYGH